jgi:hypothetical protein
VGQDLWRNCLWESVTVSVVASPRGDVCDVINFGLSLSRAL